MKGVQAKYWAGDPKAEGCLTVSVGSGGAPMQKVLEIPAEDQLSTLLWTDAGHRRQLPPAKRFGQGHAHSYRGACHREKVREERRPRPVPGPSYIYQHTAKKRIYAKVYAYGQSGRSSRRSRGIPAASFEGIAEILAKPCQNMQKRPKNGVNVVQPDNCINIHDWRIIQPSSNNIQGGNPP